jgi:putative transposase
MLCFAPGQLTASKALDLRSSAADVVFLEDRRVHRKATLKMYPDRGELDDLRRHKRLHCDLYNGAHQERIDAYRLSGTSISFADQCRSLTLIRAEIPEYAELNAQSSQVTLKRLDLAYQNFFRRVKAGETPGFPRFKSIKRFPGWGYKSHGDGFTFHPGLGWKGGTVRLASIGKPKSTIRCRGRIRTPGEVVTAEVMEKVDGWYLSLTLLCEPHREVAEQRSVTSFDWGIEHFLTLCAPDAEGKFYAGDVLAAITSHIPNPRFEKVFEEKITKAQQVLSGRKRGSHGWKKARNTLARLRKHQAECRKDFRNKLCAWLVENFHTIITEELAVKNMTASARGTAEDPGKNVAQKAGLNRSTLDGSPGSLLSRLATVAEEAGSHVIKLETKREAPSQHCPKCAARAKKELSDRVHVCTGCGHREQRDAASSRYMLGRVWGFLSPSKRRRKPARKRPGGQGRADISLREPERETPSRA